MGKLFILALSFYSLKLVRTGKGRKDGEKAMPDEILS
jgi:hypothetical protein